MQTCLKPNRSQTRNLLQTFLRTYHCTAGVQTSTPGYHCSSQQRTYIIILPKYLCTWWLMQDLLRRSRRAPAPGHDVSRQSLDLDLPKAQVHSRASFLLANVQEYSNPIQRERPRLESWSEKLCENYLYGLVGPRITCVGLQVKTFGTT